MGQIRRSVFERVGGYEDVNNAERLGRDFTFVYHAFHDGKRIVTN
jgi:hypothetical protein